MKLKLNQKGFSMMELLIALTVLALTAVPVYSMMVVAAQYVGENDMRADCLRMAENEMELQKAAGQLEWIDTANNTEDGGLIVCRTEGAMDDVLVKNDDNTQTLVKDGIYAKDGMNITVWAKQLNGNCYEITVTVSEQVETPAEGEEAPEAHEVILKGVCVLNEKTP